MFRLPDTGLPQTQYNSRDMMLDEIIEKAEALEAENRRLREKNIELILQVRRFRESLDSAMNMLDPEQLRIIRNDLIGLTI